MTYPFSDLPTSRQNDTLTATTHPSDHNAANSALNAIKAVLGSNPQGAEADVTTRLLLLDTLDTTVADLVASGALRSGVGAPADDLGKVGDFYLNTTAKTIYGPKGGGSTPWGTPTSLVGPQGIQGPAGGDVTTAAELPYDNSTSGLAATDVQAAIDEVGGVVAGLVTGADGAELDIRSSVTTNQTLDAALSEVFVLDLFGSVSVLFETSNLTAGRAYGFTVVTRQGAGQTGHTVTWPTAVIWWPKGVQPAQTTGSGGRDVWVFFSTDDGTNWFGFQSGQNMS
jgi:hypothetical protein